MLLESSLSPQPSISSPGSARRPSLIRQPSSQHVLASTASGSFVATMLGEMLSTGAISASSTASSVVLTLTECLESWPAAWPRPLTRLLDRVIDAESIQFATNTDALPTNLSAVRDQAIRILELIMRCKPMVDPFEKQRYQTDERWECAVLPFSTLLHRFSESMSVLFGQCCVLLRACQRYPQLVHAILDQQLLTLLIDASMLLMMLRLSMRGLLVQLGRAFKGETREKIGADVASLCTQIDEIVPQSFALCDAFLQCSVNSCKQGYQPKFDDTTVKSLKTLLPIATSHVLFEMQSQRSGVADRFVPDAITALFPISRSTRSFLSVALLAQELYCTLTSSPRQPLTKFAHDLDSPFALVTESQIALLLLDAQTRQLHPEDLQQLLQRIVAYLPEISSSSDTASDIAAAADAPIEPVPATYQCQMCTYENPSDAAQCEICETARPAEVTQRLAAAASRIASPASSNPNVWACSMCTFENAKSAAVCMMCQSPRPLESMQQKVATLTAVRSGFGGRPNGLSAEASQTLGSTWHRFTADWTRDLDVQLVALIDRRCDASQTLLFDQIPAESFKLTDDERASYAKLAELSDRDLPLVQLRLATLQLLNELVPVLITLTDLPSAETAHPLWCINLALQQKSCIFSSVKRRMLQSTLLCTSRPPCQNNSELPQVSIAALDAALILSSSTKDTRLDSSTFAQLWRQMWLNHRLSPSATEHKKPSHIEPFPFHLFDSALHIGALNRPNDQQRAWKTIQRGMHSDDYGGPYRDTLNTLVQELQHPGLLLPLLVQSANLRSQADDAVSCWVPDPASQDSIHASLFTFLGALFGLAIRTRDYLPFQLPPLIWKRILGEKLCLNDLIQTDVGLHRQLCELRSICQNGTIEEFDALFSERTWTTVDAAGRQVDLCANGADRVLQFAERQQFYDALLQYHLHEFDLQSQWIADGLGSGLIS